MTPFTVRLRHQQVPLAVPCGKCPECVARRTSAWSFRLMQQEKISQSAHFITLTYDTTNVPISPAGFMHLSKRDVQLFLKRLRINTLHTALHPIRYFLVGEYGGKTLRPHYHAIIFNATLELIQPSWALGDIHYGTVTGASIGYTLKYISKKRLIPLHQNDDRQPEFSLMSKGLGKNYLSPAMISWHQSDFKTRMYLNLPDNKKCSMPRYYKDKIYTEAQRKQIAHYHLHLLSIKQLADIRRLGESLYWVKKFNGAVGAFKKMHLNSLTQNHSI